MCITRNYHATPYDISATGFYFTNYEEYQTLAASHVNEYGEPVEEYEIQFIDGDYPALFRSLEINQANLELWFEHFEEMNEEEMIKALYLSDDWGCSISDIIEHDFDDITLFEGTAEDYALNYVEACGLLESMPENLRFYFDYDAFARDLVLGGDIADFQAPNGTRYIIPQNF